jgi:hypothetical protein
MGCNGAVVVSFFREVIVSSRRPLIPTVIRTRSDICPISYEKLQ